MEAQEYSLVWNEFPSYTIQTFKDLLLDKNFTDVTLVSDSGQQLNTHKVILATCSTFFRRVLLNNPHPNPLIYLQGISHQNLETILKFMYLGQAQLSQADLYEFLAACKVLKSKE